MAWITDEIGHRPLLDLATGIHDHDPVGDRVRRCDPAYLVGCLPDRRDTYDVHRTFHDHTDPVVGGGRCHERLAAVVRGHGRCSVLRRGPECPDQSGHPGHGRAGRDHNLMVQSGVSAVQRPKIRGFEARRQTMVGRNNSVSGGSGFNRESVQSLWGETLVH